MQVYRPDIDGLRAVAIIAVVLFHAGLSGTRGGFLGVDVFFVISGYLITRILLRGPEAHSLSLFYERRVRRILPALAVILAVCSLAALAILLPSELTQYGKSLLATTGIVSNFYFMRTQTYFGPEVAENPLLHLWSLAVEEQFYLLYPAAVIFLRKNAPGLLLPTLLLILMLSFALSVWLARHHPSAAFYFTPSRAWELMLGACTSLISWAKRVPRLFVEAIAVSALVVIIASTMLFDSGSSWPGWNASIPCLAAAVLLSVGEVGSTTSNLLGWRPFVWLGLISYSLYLWHWPIFCFFARSVLRPITFTEHAGLIAASLLAAWSSWRFVERPFRNLQNGISRATVFRLAAGATSIFLVAGGISYATAGLPNRFSIRVQHLDKYDQLGTDVAFNRLFDGPCLSRTKDMPDSAIQCFQPARNRSNILLWGDSLARNYVLGLRKATARENLNLIQETFPGCKPFIFEDSLRGECAALSSVLLHRLDSRVQLVILSVRLFYRGQTPELLRDFVRSITAKGIPVVVLGPAIEYTWSEPYYIEQFELSGNRRFLDSAGLLRPDLRPLDEKMQQLFTHERGVTYISILDTVCSTGHCPMLIDGVPAQIDGVHLTAPASLLVGQALWQKIRAGWKEQQLAHSH